MSLSQNAPSGSDLPAPLPARKPKKTPTKAGRPATSLRAAQDAPPSRARKEDKTSARQTSHPKGGRPARGGRPAIVFGARELRQLETLAGFGLTEAAIAHVLGCDPRTLRRKKEEAPAVAAAVERGRAQAEATIAEALFERAVSGDMSAIKWWEMTRAGRSERQETAGTLGTFDLENMTDDQLARLAAGESPARVLRGK